MKISTQYSMAVHILVAIEKFKTYKVTSEFLAKSINSNPVVIRRIMSILKDNNLIDVKFGTGGACLKSEPRNISLYDVYKIITKNEDVFDFHKNPNLMCPVGKNIHKLNNHLLAAQKEMENSLKVVTLQNVIDEMGDNNE
ncbi:MAG: Rrf2 family transcriptional regulator [bacterium]